MKVHSSIIFYLLLLFMYHEVSAQDLRIGHGGVETRCVIDDPDTSINGMSLRNSQSVFSVLKSTPLKGDTDNVYYTKDKTQQLCLVVHPGDLPNQVSLFHVCYVRDIDPKVSVLAIDKITTNNGVKLGITSKALKQVLGKCYIETFDSEVQSTVIYLVKHPNDTKDHLLSRNNMPEYYGTYTFEKDKLVKFEFGFTYP
jgi:hypothetical protein